VFAANRFLERGRGFADSAQPGNIRRSPPQFCAQFLGQAFDNSARTLAAKARVNAAFSRRQMNHPKERTPFVGSTDMHPKLIIPLDLSSGHQKISRHCAKNARTT
jgi:hypothetical protein